MDEASVNIVSRWPAKLHSLLGAQTAGAALGELAYQAPLAAAVVAGGVALLAVQWGVLAACRAHVGQDDC
ncbi:MAG TPA: hypothetical protein PKC18_03500 [Lacipirellulaceae bacterium]|nr:hypothetical protein [Lacipirellulaceae bacterium]HMP07402.1 hypothetical protein [Lacipirellulaceae bacterium]